MQAGAQVSQPVMPTPNMGNVSFAPKPNGMMGGQAVHPYDVPMGYYPPDEMQEQAWQPELQFGEGCLPPFMCGNHDEE